MSEAFLPDTPLQTPPAIGWHAQLQAQMLGKDDDAEDDDDDDDDDGDEDEDDDDGDEDPDADKTDAELRAELKKMRSSVDKYKKNSTRNYRRRKEVEAELSKRGKPAKADGGKGDKEEIDLEAEREAARLAGKAEGESKAKMADLKALLVSRGVDAANARLLIGQVKLDDLEYDEDDELDADDAIDDLKLKYPQLFGGKGTKRRVSGAAGDDKTPKKLSATEKQARALLGK